MQGIQREYEELDTVWFMGGSLFKNYPYDIPTEAFSFEIFKQAFAAIQVGGCRSWSSRSARSLAVLWVNDLIMPLGLDLASFARLLYRLDLRLLSVKHVRPVMYPHWP